MTVTAWLVEGVELPFGDRVRTLWIDESGSVGDHPIRNAERLPGRYVLPGLVDAHSHPAVAEGPAGPVALGESETRANLLVWAENGITPRP